MAAVEATDATPMAAEIATIDPTMVLDTYCTLVMEGAQPGLNVQNVIANGVASVVAGGSPLIGATQCYAYARSPDAATAMQQASCQVLCQLCPGVRLDVIAAQLGMVGKVVMAEGVFYGRPPVKIGGANPKKPQPGHQGGAANVAGATQRPEGPSIVSLTWGATAATLLNTVIQCKMVPYPPVDPQTNKLTITLLDGTVHTVQGLGSCKKTIAQDCAAKILDSMLPECAGDQIAIKLAVDKMFAEYRVAHPRKVKPMYKPQSDGRTWNRQHPDRNSYPNTPNAQPSSMGAASMGAPPGMWQANIYAQGV